MALSLSAVTIERSENAAEIRALFEEYAASVGFSLCFQGFDRELAELPGRYAAPTGAVLVARDVRTGSTAGCVALRKLDEGICEMKRLYVRPAFQGTGLGRRLVETLLGEARGMGYATMRLDTVPSMKAAIALYESLGFRDIAPYTDNPIEGARYLEVRL